MTMVTDTVTPAGDRQSSIRSGSRPAGAAGARAARDQASSGGAS